MITKLKHTTECVYKVKAERLSPLRFALFEFI